MVTCSLELRLLATGVPAPGKAQPKPKRYIAKLTAILLAKAFAHTKRLSRDNFPGPLRIYAGLYSTQSSYSFMPTSHSYSDGQKTPSFTQTVASRSNLSESLRIYNPRLQLEDVNTTRIEWRHYMAYLYIKDHANKTQVIMSSCTSDTVVECIYNLRDTIFKDLGFGKGSILRLEVNNLDKRELHQWDFDDQDPDEYQAQDDFLSMVANEKNFVFTLEATKTLGPYMALTKFASEFKKAVKSKKLQLPTQHKGDVFIYVLVDMGASAYGDRLALDMPNSKFNVGIDRYSGEAKYLKHANDLRKHGLALNPSHEWDED